MSAVGMRARADLRARPFSLLVLVLLTAIAGGVAMVALAGAERIESSYARYRDRYEVPEALVFDAVSFGAPIDLEDVGRLRQVSSFDRASNLLVEAYAADGETPLFYRESPEADVVVPEPGGWEPKVIAGRLPRSADEIAISWGDTDGPRAEVGDEIVVRAFDPAWVEENGFFSDRRPPADAYIPEVALQVVGEVLPFGDLAGNAATLFAAPAFAQGPAGKAAGIPIGVFQLRRGLEDLEEFQLGVTKIGRDAFSFDASVEAEFVTRSLRFPALVLRLFAVAVALTASLMIGQAVTRRVALGSTDLPILRSLGMTRAQVLRASLALPAIVGVAGGALAVVVAVAASPFPSTGLARLLEVDPGVAVDAGVLASGFLLIVALPVSVAFVPAWRLARARGGVLGTIEYAGADRPAALPGLLARRGLPAPAVAGTRLALDPGHGRSAIPVRSAVAGVAIAVAVAVAAFGFAASMRHFVDTPRLWGIDFTFGSGSPFGDRPVFESKAVPLLIEDPGLSDLSVGNFQHGVAVRTPNASVGVNAWGISQAKGRLVHPTLVEGRWPVADDEVAFGSLTLREIGAEVGDRVSVSAGGASAEMVIVGVPVFPDFGFGPGLGRGAGMTLEALQRFHPDAPVELALGNYAPGASIPEVIERINPTLEPMGAEVSEDDIEQLSPSVQDAGRYQRLPVYLALVFAVAALGSLVHVLLTSAQRRRTDLAILRTLGFRGRQVTATVAWQAATLVVLAFAIGAPTGLLLGRLLWEIVATRLLGVVSEPVLAWGVTMLLLPLTLVSAVLISVWPAAVARRTKPAAVLRTE